MCFVLFGTDFILSVTVEFCCVYYIVLFTEKPSLKANHFGAKNSIISKVLASVIASSTLTLFVGHQEEHPTCQN